MKHLILLLALALPACDAATPVASSTPSTATAPAPTAASRFDAGKVAAMKQRLLKEPKIADFVFDPAPMSVTWQVGVVDNGTKQIGYAEYVCMELQDNGLVDDHTDVRIVDIAKVRASGGDFRGASLGHIRCKDQEDMGV